MTNLIATILVTVVTNMATDVEREIIGTQSVQCPDGMVGCLVFHAEYQYGKEIARTETTTVTEITKLAFQWKGKQRLVEERRVLSETVKRYVKKEEWVER